MLHAHAARACAQTTALKAGAHTPETRYRLAALLLYRGRHVVVLVHHGPFWVLADDARVSCQGTDFGGVCAALAEDCWTPRMAVYEAEPALGVSRVGIAGPWDASADGPRSGSNGGGGADGWSQPVTKGCAGQGKGRRRRR